MQTTSEVPSYDVDDDDDNDDNGRRIDVQAISSRVHTFVLDHPLAALGIALGTGFFVGRLFRR